MWKGTSGPYTQADIGDWIFAILLCDNDVSFFFFFHADADLLPFVPPVFYCFIHFFLVCFLKKKKLRHQVCPHCIERSAILCCEMLPFYAKLNFLDHMRNSCWLRITSMSSVLSAFLIFFFINVSLLI